MGCREDTSYWPLFGDAGTATAVEYVEGASGMYFHTATDGSGAEAIIIPDGAYRNGISKESLKIEVDTDGLNRSKLNTKMDGMDVFAFAVSKAPKCCRLVRKITNTPRGYRLFCISSGE